VLIHATGLSTFPDISVVCGEPESASIDRNAITNPTLLVEVTSKSTEDYDRGEKLNHYRQCPSLKAVLFISHRRAQVTLVSRAGAGWDTSEYRPGEHVTVPALALELSVDELYAGIALDEG
jgi:Uma2 family endonuclease